MQSKSIFVSRTFWVNLVVLVGALAAMFGFDLGIDADTANSVADAATNAADGLQGGASKYATIVVLVQALINIVLRLVTDKPVRF